MTLLDYLNRITKEGTYCILPDELFHQKTEEQYVGDGAGGRSGVTVIKYTSESLSEQKKEAKLIKEITMRCLNCQGDNASLSRLWKALMVIVPKDFRNGEYNDDFKSWFLLFMDSICSSLSMKMLTERMTPGAKYLLNTLQIRMASWQKMVSTEIKEEGAKSISVNISGW